MSAHGRLSAYDCLCHSPATNPACFLPRPWLQGFVADGTLDRLCVAFSRAQVGRAGASWFVEASLCVAFSRAQVG